MSRPTSRRLPLMLLALFLLVASVVPASAQGTIEPIASGENRTGEVSAANPSPNYVFVASGGETLNVQVLAVTTGFAPTLRILDPSGGVVQEATNATASNNIAVSATLSAAGAYVIQIQSLNAQPGQFLISVQSTTPPPPTPTPLVVGETVPGVVNASGPRQLYTFNGQGGPLRVSVNSFSLTGSPLVTLKNADTDEMLGTGSLNLIAISFTVPPSAVNYLVEVGYSGTPDDESYNVVLEGLEASEPPENIEPTATSAGGSTTDACLATPGQADRINVRFGPGTGAGVLGIMLAGQTAPVIGRTSDNSWYQITFNGQTGWVASFVVTLSGECGNRPVVAGPVAPAQPTAAPTPPLPPTSQQPASSPEPTLDPAQFPPDLTITSLSAELRGDNGSEGTRIRVTVANIGLTASPATELQVQFPNHDIDTVGVGSLGPGQAQSFTLDKEESQTGGDYQANVDPFDTVFEASESNNNASGSL